MSAVTRKADRALIAIVAAVGVLIVVALTVVLMRGEPELLDESTPAGTVQRYSAAVLEHDPATAGSYLTEEARQRCAGQYEAPRVSRMVLVSTTERAGSASVMVSIVYSYPDSGPFGPAEEAMDGTFSLLKVDGKWLVDQAPGQLVYCTGSQMKP